MWKQVYITEEKHLLPYVGFAGSSSPRSWECYFYGVAEQSTFLSALACDKCDKCDKAKITLPAIKEEDTRIESSN